MSATGAKPAFGTLAKVTITATPTTIAEIYKITPPASKRDTVDATHMESPSGFKEFIKGLAEAGEFGIEANYTSTADQDYIRTDFVSGATGAYQIVVPTGTPETWSFSAIVTEYGLGEMTPEGKLSFKATFKITGVITVT